jgi:cell division septation protein DedD
MIIAFVMIGSFVLSKAAKKKQAVTTHTQTTTPLEKEDQESASQAPKKVFFYKSIGESNPQLAKEQATQQVTKYTVHVQTVNTKKEAELLLVKMSQAGFIGFYTPMRSGGKVNYHVRLGIFADQSEANQTLVKMAKKTSIQGSVTKLQ